MVIRVPSENVTNGFPKILPAGHPDLIWMNPKDVLIGGESIFRNYQAVPVGASGASLVASNTDTVVKPNELTVVAATNVDTVSMADIESITYTQYYDAVTKAAKYKAVIKIRNSSTQKANVQGVDARIYNPSREAI